MDRAETLAIMTVLKTAYPGYYRDMKPKEAENVVNLWAEMFRDEPAGLVAAAVKAYIAQDRKGYPPHIGAIKDAIVRVMLPDRMTEQEAASVILQAASNGVYGAEEEFDKLPPVLRRLVGSPAQLREWAMMDAESVQSVVASNLQRSYREIDRQERERLTLPADVRQTMEQITAEKETPSLTDGRR